VNEESAIKDQEENQVSAETLPEEKEDEAPTKPASEEDLLKEIEEEEEEEEDVAQLVSELLRGQKIASVYIDARSGGAFFSGKTEVSGDVVGRNQVKGKAPSASSTLAEAGVGRVLSKELAKAHAVYVEPPPFAQAKRILGKRRVIVLWGQAHVGKWTTALHLLSVYHPEEIYEINPDIEMEKLRSLEFEPGKGYVIDTFAPEDAEDINSFFLKHLSRQLEGKHCHLVVTVDSRVSLSREKLDDYLVVWQDVPNRDQLLDKHLNWYLSDEKRLAKAHELKEDGTVQHLLGTHLLPGEIDRLAELLAEAARGELELEQTLTRFEAHAREQAAKWFKTHTDPQKRTFMLSLAVFSGANYQAVVEADDKLQSQIGLSPMEDESTVADTVFGSPRSRRLEEAGAHLVQGYEEAEFGRSSVELVTLDNPAFQPAVLHYAWHEYDRLRKPLLDWLQDLGTDPSFNVRARAAAAIGELSKYNFGYVRRQVLIPWANHRDDRARAAAALALGVPVWEGELAPQVLGLLNHWATLRNNWRLCWTAAVAYGGSVGLRFPDIALGSLRTIARAEDLRLFRALSQSTANLFESGKFAPDYHLKVLDALDTWTSDSKDNLVTLSGLLIFLQLAVKAKVDTEPEGETWPTLLWLAREDEVYRERITALWRRALNTKSVRKRALDVLKEWLLTIDDDTRLYSTLEEIITLIATQGTEREENRLRFYLDRWASHPKEECQSAAKALAALDSS
jgi:hypothetical protein